MGNLLSFIKPKRGVSRATSSSNRGNAGASLQSPSMRRNHGQSSNVVEKKLSVKKKYGYIPDNFSSIEQVTEALRSAGLESSNLILGIDFTKSNEWTGQVSFNNRSLHAIGDIPNPYEKAIAVIGKTLAPFDEDNLIPCFGFGDATTHDEEVFSFHSDNSPCHGFEEVLSCYRKVVPALRLSGPTSYAPVVEAAIDIVEKSGGQYHVLVIIADGQVTRSVNTGDNELSPQEAQTIQSIVNASSYPLSIVLVGVGDGPWEDMKKFDDKIPAREFDNFQFVNFTEIMSKNGTPSSKETAFALATLMEIPFQYKAATELNLLGHVTGRAKKIVPRPPPTPYTRRPPPTREPSILSSSTPTGDERNQSACPICLTNPKDLAFGCGHMTCRDCGPKVSNCPICRQPIRSRIRLFTG
ncbi:E3 ubiquitin-protein ligase RGLG4-like [Juglans microcarpa x Juglans regia]|uniref:E3 ubiquitin-protein ligase RGLG4-like n=1 Tax=Juglans microcarpa x Juglans regia TaxID=2249226 RepID=UPI001B7E304D|nr:E3 ubiquitin-protein ligase RGLG4-like [Juglans microcarpa x Juglans regia]XP_040997651.1 E3 ubiquitin-protein ligase RGLG4-like [Juglans microcarpa x Juglans regia]